MQTFKLILFILCFSGVLLVIAKLAPAFFPNIGFNPQQHIVNNFTQNPKPQQVAGSFVKRDGTKLILDGKEFRVVGVNVYDLAYQSNEVIDQTFDTMQQAGVTTIRFWLFDDGNQNGFQPEPGKINESRFKQADYVFFVAQKYNMKVIPVLINNWSDYGGKEQYTKWVGKSYKENDPSFYTDFNIKALFENYLSYVFARRNSYTNIPYIEDPTILGWDIMNEPRSLDNASMNDWLTQIAKDMKAHDPNHLVFAGTERAIGPHNNEGKASDLCKNDAIDVCSVHLYLFDQQKPLFHSYNDVEQYLQTQKEYAKDLNKPLLLEEFGIATDTRPFGQNQLTIMKQLLREVKNEQWAGYLVWDWAHEARSPFTFSPEGNGGMSYGFADLKELLRF